MPAPSTQLGRLRPRRMQHFGPIAARCCSPQTTIDPTSREVRVDGTRVELSQKEFALLRALASDPTRVWTKRELLRDIWGYRADGRTRTFDSHACRLRHKLAAHECRFVINVWSVGYRLVDGNPRACTGSAA